MKPHYCKHRGRWLVYDGRGGSVVGLRASLLRYDGPHTEGVIPLYSAPEDAQRWLDERRRR